MDCIWNSAIFTRTKSNREYIETLKILTWNKNGKALEQVENKYIDLLFKDNKVN